MAVDKTLAMKYLIETLSPTVSLSPSGVSSVNYTYFDYWVNLGLADMANASTNTFTPEQVAQIEANKNNLVKVVDDINTIEENCAAKEIKIEKNITDIANHDGSIVNLVTKSDTQESDIQTNITDIAQLQTEYHELAQHITEVQQDKANITEITRLELKIDGNTHDISSLGWNPQYKEWQTFLEGLDEDGNNNESGDYPPVNEPFNYALNKKYKLLDIDEAGYIMGIKTNLTEERLCFIDKLNESGDLIRSTQTSDDWIVDVVYDFDTKVTTISVDFKKDTIRDFKLTLMRLEDKVTLKESTNV